MIRFITPCALCVVLGLALIGCQSSGSNDSSAPSGSPAQTPQGNMQGPAHSNGTEGADTAQSEPPVSQSPNSTGTVDQRMTNQGRLPTTAPQP